MDETGYSIVAQTAAKAATELWCAIYGNGSGPWNEESWDAIYTHVGKSILGSAKRAYAAEQQGAPFAPAQQQPPPQQVPAQSDPFPPQGVSAPVQQPVPQSQPVAQPSQPQPVMAGPPCPNCQTPTVPTKDYAAKKARNLAEGKKAPPMWKCPMGSYDWQTKTAQGCQGSIWEPEAA